MSHVHVKLEQQPFAMIPKALFDYVTDANAIKLYIGLFTWASGEGHCYPTFTQIQERINMSRATITKSMNKLKEAGLLVVEKGEKKGNLKANNIYFLATNLAKKAPSSKIEPRDFSSSNSKLEPSSNSDIPLVQEIDYNENQLMKININDNQEGAKAPALTKSIDNRFSQFEDSLREYHSNNPSKYPKEMYLAFRDYWGEKNKSGKKMRFEDQKYWELGKRLATWHKRENEYSSKSSNGDDKCYAEKEFDFKRQKLRDTQAWIQEIKERNNLNFYQGEQVGKIS